MDEYEPGNDFSADPVTCDDVDHGGPLRSVRRLQRFTNDRPWTGRPVDA